VLASSDTEVPTAWFPYAELWIGDTHIGTFEEDTYNTEWSGWDSVESRHKISPLKERALKNIFYVRKLPLRKTGKIKRGY
jgi:hypothetical protein